MMLLCNNPPQMSQITTTESMPGLIHNTKKLIQPSGKQKLLKLLKVDTKSPPKKHTDLNSLKPQMFQITTIESMPGLIHNTKKLIQPSGKQKLQKLLKVDTMSLPKEHTDLNSLKPQMFQITTIESMLGLTHNTKKPTQLSGKPKLLRSPKVDTMSPPKEDQEVNSLKPQMSQITTTESTPGLIHNTKKLIQPNGKQKLLKLLKVDTKLPPKEDQEVNSLKPQMSQITTTESMPGLIHNTKKLTQLNGKQKLLKLLKVDTMSLLKKDPEFQETL
jgi:hypothetical protein